MVKGGKTLFFNSKKDDTIIGSYEAKKGDLIIFDHKLWHSGAVVTNGEKYILRSDIIYRKISEAPKKKKTFCGEGHLGYIWTATVWNDRLLTSGRDKKNKIWSNKGCKENVLLGHESSILNLTAFDKRTILSSSRDGTIKIWKYTDVNKFRLEHSGIYCEGAVLAICKIDDHTFFSGGADGRLKRIKITGEQINTIEAHKEWIWGISKVTKDYFATISEDGSLKIWDIKQQKLVTTWQDNIPITSISIEDSRIYIGRFDGSILIFNFKKKLSLINRENCHLGIIRRLMVTQKYLYSASEDCTAKIWNKVTLKLVKTFAHKNFVQDLALFEDVLITVSYDGEIRSNIEAV